MIPQSLIPFRRYPMLLDGLIIMLVGMFVVFFFLILIIISMRIMSAVVQKFFPEKEVPVANVIRKSDDSEIAAAIAAVKAFTKA
jgi:oxaloacetate decarboxylase gamma subunit